MLRAIQFIVGLLLLVATEFLRVYFIMPLPGSQRSETVELAYFIHTNIFWMRTVGLLIIIFPLVHFYWLGSVKAKILVSVGLIAYVFAFYQLNYKMSADKMFLMPTQTVYASGAANVIEPDQLVVGIEVDGKAKAYPISIIGYHHQVRDTIGNQHLMITYCTVCRTGRIFRPVVNNKTENFRLVGMDHFNAMFEDETTNTWWRQVNGEAVAGPLKGLQLEELPTEQMTLRAWLEAHPNSTILQPDTIFNKRYERMREFQAGELKEGLLMKDSLSWQEKSWVVGVQVGSQARAYDWNDLLTQKVINDTLGNTPVLIVLERDSASFHVWKRDSLTFSLQGDTALVDEQTTSQWSWTGQAVAGSLTGQKLPTVQSYQEYWFSWQTFRPNTTKYQPENAE